MKQESADAPRNSSGGSATTNGSATSGTGSGAGGGETPVLRGANIARKRSVLGRGLQALMSPTAVPVDIGGLRSAGDGVERRAALDQTKFDEPTHRSREVGGVPAPSDPEAGHTPADPVQSGRESTAPQSSSLETGTSSPSVPAGTRRPTRGDAARTDDSRIGGVSEGRGGIQGGTQSGGSGAPHSEAPLVTADSGQEGLLYIPLDRVLPNKAQPRQHFPQDEIDRLADSVRKTGLLQPILVRRRPSDAGPLPTYEIIAGERRWRAARQAGLGKIPAILRQLSDREALELGIVENVQRSDLNPIEEALAYYRLSEEFGANQSEIAEKVGKDRTSIANALRLLKLSEEVQKLLVSGVLSAGHGRALLGFSQPGEQRTIADRIIAEGLSVREVERLAAEGRSASGGKRMQVNERPADIAVEALEERLRRALGTKVKLRLADDGKGELRISFFSQSELESLLERLHV